jgi:hypothetical protein
VGGLVWVLGFGGGSFFLRCPHCRQPVFITPGGGSLPWAGSQCRHCRKPY